MNIICHICVYDGCKHKCWALRFNASVACILPNQSWFSNERHLFLAPSHFSKPLHRHTTFILRIETVSVLHAVGEWSWLMKLNEQWPGSRLGVDETLVEQSNYLAEGVHPSWGVVSFVCPEGAGLGAESGLGKRLSVLTLMGPFSFSGWVWRQCLSVLFSSIFFIGDWSRCFVAQPLRSWIVAFQTVGRLLSPLHLVQFLRNDAI